MKPNFVALAVLLAVSGRAEAEEYRAIALGQRQGDGVVGHPGDGTVLGVPPPSCNPGRRPNTHADFGLRISFGSRFSGFGFHHSIWAPFLCLTLLH